MFLKALKGGEPRHIHSSERRGRMVVAEKREEPMTVKNAIEIPRA